ncbi:NLR family member X1 [Callorhinchus milii]|uniref:NLR family member X1 n=1 Tax=Callorhinchus milii TaxID=7868 RepID=UPI001C3FA92A|nr:NLR family member X1 [Callorhinchus milii]
MSEAAVQCLGAAIAGNRSLSHLSLARTCLGDVGVEALAGHLEANTHLKELNLAYNQLSDQAALRLMEVAKKHPTLEKVHLYFNELSDASKARLRGLRPGRDGVQVLVSVTDGVDISAYWALVLANVERSPAGDRQLIAERLALFRKDLSEGRHQTWNPWKKVKFLRVEYGVRRLLKKIERGA